MDNIRGYLVYIGLPFTGLMVLLISGSIIYIRVVEIILSCQFKVYWYFVDYSYMSIIIYIE